MIEIIPVWNIRFTFRGEELWFRVAEPDLESFIKVCRQNWIANFSCERIDGKVHPIGDITEWEKWCRYMKREEAQNQP